MESSLRFWQLLLLWRNSPCRDDTRKVLRLSGSHEFERASHTPLSLSLSAHIKSDVRPILSLSLLQTTFAICRRKQLTHRTFFAVKDCGIRFDNAVTWFWFVKIQSFFFLHLRNCYLIILLCGFDRLIQSFSLQCKKFLFEAAVLWLWSWLFWFECDLCDFLDARSSLVITKLIQVFLQNSFVYECGSLFSMEIEIP